MSTIPITFHDQNIGNNKNKTYYPYNYETMAHLKMGD